MKNWKRAYAAGGWTAVLLGMLGFASCGEKDPPPVEYGAPYATFEVNGTVRMSGTSEALSDVRVRPLIKWGGAYYDHPYAQAVQSNVQGRFSIQLGADYFQNNILPLEFFREGVVKTDTVDVSFDGVPHKEGKGWYTGKATLTTDFSLDPAPVGE